MLLTYMATRMSKCRKCSQYLSYANFDLNYRTGGIYTHCNDCRSKKNPPQTVKTYVSCAENINIPCDEDIKADDVVVTQTDNNEVMHVSNAEELKAVFIDYGFKADRIFIAKHTGEFFEALINIKNQDFIKDNILGIFEIDHDTSFEKMVSMSSIGIDPCAISLFKYAVYLKFYVDPATYRLEVRGFGEYGLTSFTNFVSKHKLLHRKTCNICYGKKRSFKTCYRCNNECCSSCFYKNAEHGLTCSYCRYTFLDHYKYYDGLIDENIKYM